MFQKYQDNSVHFLHNFSHEKSKCAGSLLNFTNSFGNIRHPSGLQHNDLTQSHPHAIVSYLAGSAHFQQTKSYLSRDELDVLYLGRQMIHFHQGHVIAPGYSINMFTDLSNNRTLGCDPSLMPPKNNVTIHKRRSH